MTKEEKYAFFATNKAFDEKDIKPLGSGCKLYEVEMEFSERKADETNAPCGDGDADNKNPAINKIVVKYNAWVKPGNPNIRILHVK